MEVELVEMEVEPANEVVKERRSVSETVNANANGREVHHHRKTRWLEMTPSRRSRGGFGEREKLRGWRRPRRS